LKDHRGQMRLVSLGAGRGEWMLLGRGLGCRAPWLERVVDADPFDAKAEAGLGRLALQRKDSATAVRAFRAALATNPPDRATAHTDLAEAHVAAGQLKEAKTETLNALEIAPSYNRALDLLLKINESAK